MSATQGAALVHELEQHFVTSVDAIRLPGVTVDLLQPRNADDLISEADFVADDRLPYWADLWPSAVLLATRLVEEEGHGRSCLELGCGLGLVTIAAMQSGFDVLATDYYADALRFTRANAWRSLGREPATRLVDWRAMPDDLGVFQRVVAADVLYEHRYASLVANALARTLAPEGEALISDSGRTATPEFLRECSRVGLQLCDTDVRPFEEGEIRQRITIYTLRKV